MKKTVVNQKIKRSEYKKIKSLYKKLKSLREVANLYKVHHTTIRTILKKI